MDYVPFGVYGLPPVWMSYEMLIHSNVYWIDTIRKSQAEVNCVTSYCMCHLMNMWLMGRLNMFTGHSPLSLVKTAGLESTIDHKRPISIVEYHWAHTHD